MYFGFDDKQVAEDFVNNMNQVSRRKPLIEPSEVRIRSEDLRNQDGDPLGLDEFCKSYRID